MSTLVLPASICIADMADIQSRFLDALQNQSEITVDVATVARVDTAGLQLLLSFLREAAVRRIPVEMQGRADEIDAAVERLGLSAEIQMS